MSVSPSPKSQAQRGSVSVELVDEVDRRAGWPVSCVLGEVGQDLRIRRRRPPQTTEPSAAESTLRMSRDQRSASSVVSEEPAARTSPLVAAASLERPDAEPSRSRPRPGSRAGANWPLDGRLLRLGLLWHVGDLLPAPGTARVSSSSVASPPRIRRAARCSVERAESSTCESRPRARVDGEGAPACRSRGRHASASSARCARCLRRRAGRSRCASVASAIVFRRLDVDACARPATTLPTELRDLATLAAAACASLLARRRSCSRLSSSIEPWSAAMSTTLAAEVLQLLAPGRSSSGSSR